MTYRLAGDEVVAEARLLVVRTAVFPHAPGAWEVAQRAARAAKNSNRQGTLTGAN